MLRGDLLFNMPFAWRRVSAAVARRHSAAHREPLFVFALVGYIVGWILTIRLGRVIESYAQGHGGVQDVACRGD